MTTEELRQVTKEIDSLLVSAGSISELYRKLNTLQRNGRGGWITLRSPVWIGDRLVAVMVRVSPDEATEETHEPALAPADRDDRE